MSPTDLRKYTIYLSDYLRKALVYINSAENEPILILVVKIMIVAISILITKLQNTPDMSAIIEALASIQNDLKTIVEIITILSQETNQFVKATTEKRRTTTALIQKTNDITKEINNNTKVTNNIVKTIQSIPSSKALYISVLTSNTVPLSKPIILSTQTSLFYKIIVKITDPTTIESLQAKSPRNLQNYIDHMIEQSRNEYIKRICIASANQLKSRDLSIKTSSRNKAEALRQFANNWISRIGRDLLYRTRISNTSDSCQGLCLQRQPRPLSSNLPTQKTQIRSSTKISYSKARYSSARRTQYKANIVYSYYTEKHNSKDYSTKTDKSTTRKYNNRYLVRKTKLSKVKVAYNTRQPYHFVPSTKEKAPKRIYTGAIANNTQNKNRDTIISESSQRPRRPYIPSRRALESITTNSLHNKKEFRIHLVYELPTTQCPKTRSALDRYIGEIVAAIQAAINHSTPLKRWSPRTRAGYPKPEGKGDPQSSTSRARNREGVIVPTTPVLKDPIIDIESEIYQTATSILQGSLLLPILYLFYNADLATRNRTPLYQDISITLLFCDRQVPTYSSYKATPSRGRPLSTSRSDISQFIGKQQISRDHTRYSIELETSYSEYNNKDLESDKPGRLYIGSKYYRTQKDLLNSRYPSDDIQLFGLTTNSLKRLQAKVARIIGGIYKATSGTALDIELHLLPIEQQIWKTNTKTVSRILSTENIPTLAGFHILRNTRNQGRQILYISPLEHIYRCLYQCRDTTIEEQEPIPPYIWQGLYIRITSSSEIAKNQYKEFLKHSSEHLFIYTDNSSINNQVGATTVSPLVRTTKIIYIGNSETSTVYTTELQSIKLALEITDEDTEKENKRNKLIIFTDNQAAIRAFQNPANRSDHEIYKSKSTLLIQIQTEKIGLRDHLWKRKVPEFDDPGYDYSEEQQTVSHILLRYRNYQDLQQREFGIQGQMDLRAILNESKSATKAIRFMEQTHLLGQFRRLFRHSSPSDCLIRI
ncbi:zinc knuckle protein [Rutstroemia sp. NJR-2017a BVV2]|nr:zinc knuckle protein [Rutstroemia sp. NJR-2017a BVV2]